MLIRMTSGTFGYREKTKDGYSLHVVCKSRNDPPFEVDDEVGNDLIGRGVAVLAGVVTEATSKPSDGVFAAGDVSTPPSKENDAEDNGEDDSDISAPKYSVEMTANQLRAIMKANGLSVKNRMTKSEMVDALDGYFGTNDEEGDGEMPPDLSAEAPIV